jgi:trigger factor
VPDPAEYENAAVAGKTAELDVQVKDIRTKELPPLDDDFARDHGRCDSLAALRQRIRVDLEQQATSRADETVREELLAQALKRHSFEVPPSLVERRVEAMVAGLGVRLAEGAQQEHAVAELRKQLESAAERQVRGELFLDAVAQRDGLEVSDADVDAAVQNAAAREGQPVERVRGLYANPDARAALRAKLVRERALAALVACARVMPQSAAESVAHEK